MLNRTGNQLSYEDSKQNLFWKYLDHLQPYYAPRHHQPPNLQALPSRSYQKPNGLCPRIMMLRHERRDREPCKRLGGESKTTVPLSCRSGQQL